MSHVLQFGGGKDSWATLYLLRDQWDSLTVVYLNTGDAFPETLEQFERVKALGLKTLEVKSDVKANIAEHGHPSDVLPVRNAHMGRVNTGESGIQLQSWFTCCLHNFWLPLHKAMIDYGATVIYRGQRLSEDYKSPIRDGQSADGIEYRFPLESWSEAQVEAYLIEQGVEIPAHYRKTAKSLDCLHCTAYLDAKLDQLSYLKDEHPTEYIEVMGVLGQINTAVNVARQPLEIACALMTS